MSAEKESMSKGLIISLRRTEVEGEAEAVIRLDAIRDASVVDGYVRLTVKLPTAAKF